MTSIPVRRLNHAVLYVRDVERSVAFYRDVLGLEPVHDDWKTMGAAFLRARGSENDHDLGLFAIGDGAPGPVRGAVGLYHLAWEVGRIEDLVEARETLRQAGSLVGQSDHGATKSLYAMDPDGNEFEVMWAVPRDRLAEVQGSPPVAPLDLEAVVAQFAG
jgi:catechol-2,3-dioxygenase